MNYLVDPKDVTNYEESYAELELKILFWICAAGKNGITSAKRLSLLLTEWCEFSDSKNPFDIIRTIIKISNLSYQMKKFGIGCYNNKSKSFKDLIEKKLDLKECTAEDLENVYGIGRKTARCFIIHSRKNARYAGLDTHCLSFLRDLGIETPKSTPSSKKEYLKLESIFLEIADSVNKNPSELDQIIWNVYSGRVSDPFFVNFIKSIHYELRY